MTVPTYSIIRSHRDGVPIRSVQTVVESGLVWEDAEHLRGALDAAERKANPTKSSWTRDLFIIKKEAAK